ncbi:MAG: hypothetical protein D5R97_09445 [Candidatus Syntrophonatronum acetioxidans]|uniref:Polymerase beta nucleotidyltransferase domain-containing protein n=1 Tax=Candidatus Syntrophonatronum acetioxidans TaxID=1795816 RepID=A0A424YA77_9FIRM|nr:MAG: hypothetical protein D5R97_09445 [Candidatus Syntrophonatronum acetioxidans]
MDLEKRRELEELAREYDLQLLILLGSYGTPDFQEEKSDIDLAFLSRKAISGNDKLKLLRDLGSFFQYCQIDLIDLGKASGLMKYEVALKGRLLYERKRSFFENYRLYCFRYYYDTRKFRLLKKEQFKEQLEVMKE